MNAARTHFGLRDRKDVEARAARKRLIALKQELAQLRAAVGDVASPLRLATIRRYAIVKAVLAQQGALPAWA